MAKRATVALLALVALSACHPARIGEGRNGADRPVIVTKRLVCPARVGDLIRTDMPADGLSCRYAADDKRVVALSYMSLDGADAPAALRRVENDLRSRLGAPSGPARQDDADRDNKDEDADDDVQTTKDGADGQNVSINLPGLHIEAKNGDAHIRAFGQTIDADKRGGAVISGRWNGSANEIHANNGGVEMRFGFVGRQAADMTFILTSNQPGASGLKLVGYVARGPVAGPLVLATVTAPTAPSQGGRTDFKDVDKLVAGNVSP